MNTKQIAAIVVVIIIIVAAVAVYIVYSDDDDVDPDDTTVNELEIGTYVPIYGNANNDLYIDERDIAILQQIIDEEIEWDENAMPYADANVDGVIDESDIELIQKIINVEECTVYYEDYFETAVSVNFPLVDVNIAVTYYQQAEACAILGVVNDIVVACKAASVYSTMWPVMENVVEFGTTGTSTIDDDAVEKIIANDVQLIINTPRVENQETVQRLHDERGIDNITLWYNGDYCISTIMTMGILMDRIDEAQKYTDYCNEVIDKLTSTLDGVELADILVISGYTASSDQLSILANERHGCYVLINKYLGNCYYEDGTNQFGFVYRNVEWLVENSSNFDYIVNCMSGNSGYANDESTGTYYTEDDYNEKFEEIVSYFEMTDAYQNGNIIGSVYPNMFGFSAYAFIEFIAAQMYPDLFSLDDALETLQTWFDEINVCDIDVSEGEGGPFSYTGTEFVTSYPQL